MSFKFRDKSHVEQIIDLLLAKIREAFPRRFTKEFIGFKFFIDAADSPAIQIRGKAAPQKPATTGFNSVDVTIEISVLVEATDEIIQGGAGEKNERELSRLADSLAEFLVSADMIRLYDDPAKSESIRLRVDLPKVIDLTYGARQNGTRSADITATYTKTYLRS